MRKKNFKRKGGKKRRPNLLKKGNSQHYHHNMEGRWVTRKFVVWPGWEDPQCTTTLPT